MNKKETLEQVLQEEKDKLHRAELKERYISRRSLADKNLENLLGQVQLVISETKDYIKFLEEVKKEK